MWRADIASSRRTGTWEASFTAGLVGSPQASQGEVLHPWRQVRAAARPQRLELLVPRLEVPDFEMAALPHEHHLPRDVGEVAQLGGDEEAPGGIGLAFLGETHEEALPQVGLAVEAWKRHDLRADRLPRRHGVEQ